MYLQPAPAGVQWKHPMKNVLLSLSLGLISFTDVCCPERRTQKQAICSKNSCVLA